MQDKTSTISPNIPCGLYVLKHKDFDVAMVDIVYLPEELPIGCNRLGKNIVGRT